VGESTARSSVVLADGVIQERRFRNPFYNCVRLHPTFGNLSPAACEAKWTGKEPICLSEITSGQLI
jgi:hypothetical protein